MDVKHMNEDNEVNEAENRDFTSFNKKVMDKMALKQRREDDSLNKYPLYEPKPLKWEPPAAYFHYKVPPEPEPEYVPPPKPPMRPINPHNLSDSQKDLWGKSPFEQDLIIMQKKKGLKQKEKDNKKKRISSQPPNIYLREERERRIKETRKNEMIEELKKHKQKENKKLARKNKKEKERLELIRVNREKELEEIGKMQHELRMQALKERQNILDNITIEPNRQTRASHLKADSCRMSLELEKIENSRDRLNREIRREKQRECTHKLSKIISTMNREFEVENKNKNRKAALRRNERKWINWLSLTEQTNRIRPTMLEREYLYNEELN